MRASIVYPYLRAVASRLVAEPWQTRQGDELTELGPAIPGWDYNTDVRLERELEVDLAGVRSDCGLTPEDVLAVASSWISGGTGLRGLGECCVLTGKTRTKAQLSFTIPGHLLAGNLTITTALLLKHPSPDRPRLAARLPGSRLWEDEQRIHLEGVTSRFPVESLDFTAEFRLPDDGAWILEWSSEDLHLPVLGGLRLLVNNQREAILRAVITPDAADPASQIIRSSIYYDVGRTMLIGCLENPEFLDNPEQFGEGTVGEAAYRLLISMFSESPTSVAARRNNDPSMFECELQGKFRFLVDLDA